MFMFSKHESSANVQKAAAPEEPQYAFKRQDSKLLVPTSGSGSMLFSPDEDEDLAQLLALDTVRAQAPLVISPSRDDFDRLALLLRKSIKTGANRRRWHSYDKTFYGESAIKWLVGMQVVHDSKDAKNAMRHLVDRRIIVRTDHTRPLLDPFFQRVNPKLAAERRSAFVERYQLGEVTFHPEHLYKFNPSAFTKMRLTVNIVSASGLKYKTRLNVGGLILSSKFREQQMDPYVSLELGEQHHSTSIVHNNANPKWDEAFSLLLPEGDSMVDESLWMRVYDFHEVLDNLELGYICLPVQRIINECAQGKVFCATMPLAQSVQMDDHAKVLGLLTFEIEHVPFKSPNPEWTVYPEARESEFDREKRRLHQVNSDDGEQRYPTGSDPPGLFHAITGLATAATPDSGKKKMVIKFSSIKASGVRFPRPDSQHWVEFSAGGREGRSPVIFAKNMPDIGEATLSGIDPETFATGSLRVALFQKYDLMKVKMGSGRVLLRRLTHQTPAYEWDVLISRTAPFKRDSKRQIGSILFKVDIDIQKDEESYSEGDEGGGDDDNKEEQVIDVEDVLLSLLEAKASNDTTFVAPEPFKVQLAPPTEIACSINRLVALICCKKSPVFTDFAKARNLTEVELGDWSMGSGPHPLADSGNLHAEAAAFASPHGSQAGRTLPPLATEEAPKGLQEAERAGNFTTSRFLTSLMMTPAPLLRQESLKKLELEGVPELPTQPASQDTTSALPTTVVEGQDNPSPAAAAAPPAAPGPTEVPLTISDTHPTRTVTFVMPASSLIKALKVFETHRLTKVSKTGFVLEIEGRTPDAPYGSTFSTHIQFCANTLDEKRCTLKISSETRFSERGFLAGTIESSAAQGAKETYLAYLQVLKKAVRGTKKRGDQSEELEVVVERPQTMLQWGWVKFKLVAPLLVLVLVVVLIVVLYVMLTTSAPGQLADLSTGQVVKQRRHGSDDVHGHKSKAHKKTKEEV